MPQSFEAAVRATLANGDIERAGEAAVRAALTDGDLERAGKVFAEIVHLALVNGDVERAEASWRMLEPQAFADIPGNDLERTKIVTVLGGIYVWACVVENGLDRWLSAVEKVYAAVTGGAVTNPLEKSDVVIAACRQYILNMWKTSSAKEQ